MSDADNSQVDFKNGFPVQSLGDGEMVLGQVDGEEILLVRRAGELLAIGAHCTHYHGPLGEGLIVGDTVRCPWHHACFSLHTGEAVAAPALDDIARWRVERVGDLAFVREKLPSRKPRSLPSSVHPSSVVIVGGGAAGLAAADMLRREGYAGTVTMLSADSSAPYDRPNLSKDYLAGTAQEDWIPLRSAEYYTEQQIELVLNARVSALDLTRKQVQVENGKAYAFAALLIATGAEPVRLQLPGATPDQVLYLRTFADSKAIIARAESARRVVVGGASFIGLEVAASLRARGIEVHVVAPDQQPLARVMGPEVGRFIRQLHESRGVNFHLETTIDRVDARQVMLSDGTTLDADFVVLGVGVRPVTALAQQASLAIDRGVVVNEFLETSAPGVYAAGDLARWPDPHSGERIRVEHWVVAERQGQTAAKNILGQRVKFDAVPFFWSQHYDLAINYVGHAQKWDAIDIDGSLDARDCAVRYNYQGRTLAVATISRDLESLRAETMMEQQTVAP